ncbi:MAG: tetratricopeptide repeat protein [Desulfovibrio sp.]|nr:tetratricopeptide repeat protein [Desulfovibrio sp.]
MLKVAPKDLRENIARANGYLRRNEVARALNTMGQALRQFAGVQLMRAARAELDIQISEFLGSLMHHQAMQPLLDPGATGRPKQIKYQQGKEGALATVLEGLARIMTSEAEAEIRREAEERAERKKMLIETGTRLLAEGQLAKGRAFLKRVAEEFSQDPGIRVQLAKIFLSAGRHMEAAEMFEESIEHEPREAQAYSGAVNTWLELREYERAEKVFMAILRTFGGHPNTFGKMAKMYWDWHKRDKAEELAGRALQGNSSQAEALEVMEALKQRQSR